MDLLAMLTIEDGRPWGEVAEPWQVDDATAIFDLDGPRLHWLGRTKGSSKSTDIAGCGLAWLVAVAKPLEDAYLVAGDLEQADRLADRARGLLARTPGLPVKAQKSELIHTRTGAKLRVISADASTAEGILPGLLLLDEVPNWPTVDNHRRLWAAVFSAQAKTNCPLVVIGHAGSPGSWQHKIFQQAQSSAAWRVADRSNVASWIDPAAIESQRDTLLPHEFARRWRNEWVAGEESLSEESNIRAAARDGFLEPVPGQSYVISVDIGRVRDHTGIAVLHSEYGPAGTKYVIDRVQRFTPAPGQPVSLTEVEDLVRNWAAWYRASRLVYDPSQFESSVERLKLPSTPFHGTATMQNEMARAVYQGFRDGRVSFPDSEGLLDDLLGMKIVEKGVGQVRLEFDRRGRSGHGDVGQAVVMGVWWLAGRSTTPVKVHSPVAMLELEDGTRVQRRHKLTRAPSPFDSANANPADRDAEAALAAVGKQPTGLPVVREPGGFGLTRRNPRLAGSRPGWGANRRR